MKPSFYQLSYQDLELVLETNKLHRSAAKRLYNSHYKKKRNSICVLQISKNTRSFLESQFCFELPQIISAQESTDQTVKFLFKLKDGKQIETVLIPFHNKYSICLSSQVGCAMNCSFCFTGTQGFKRQLSVDEITGQFLEVHRWLVKNRPGKKQIRNIVFMGQGEPLHNFDAIKKSCEIFLSSHGAAIGAQKITVSTSGYLPGLQRWSNEMPPVNLALSLHSPFTEKRNELIPINRKYPLKDILKLIDEVPLSKKQFITYEYLLIDNFNDSQEDAHETGQLLAGKRAYINIIPFNPFPGSKYKKPNFEKTENFKKILDTYKIPTLIRRVKGNDVLAACGQLNTATDNYNS